MSLPRPKLLASAQALCSDFANKASLETLLAHFSTTFQVSAHEHGLPFLAPFLGRTFPGLTGPRSIADYFTTIQKLLSYENMSFSDWTVDAETQRVCTRGKARFTWLEGKGKDQWWDEEFVYMLDFDNEGKVTDYQVWADSGAAYLAMNGELNTKREEFERSQETV